jgi:hypothetical protein
MIIGSSGSVSLYVVIMFAVVAAAVDTVAVPEIAPTPLLLLLFILAGSLRFTFRTSSFLLLQFISAY